MLTIPDVRQENGWSCGDAVIAAVLAFHKIVRRAREATAIDGLEPAGIERVLRRLGMNVIAGSMSIADLGHYCQTKRPPIVLTTCEDGESHWCVVAGANRRSVHYHDPLEGKKTMSIAKWESIWHGDGRLGERYRRWAIVAYPHVSA